MNSVVHFLLGVFPGMPYALLSGRTYSLAEWGVSGLMSIGLAALFITPSHSGGSTASPHALAGLVCAFALSYSLPLGQLLLGLSCNAGALFDEVQNIAYRAGFVLPQRPAHYVVVRYSLSSASILAADMGVSSALLFLWMAVSGALGPLGDFLSEHPSFFLKVSGVAVLNVVGQVRVELLSVYRISKFCSTDF